MADGLIVPAPSSVRPLNAVAQGPAPGGAANGGSGDRTGTWFTLPAAPIGGSRLLRQAARRPSW